ncbi:hypothetical protein Pint_07051 [Pistacia integerrima]|uniref:Uncharacterized protein n=1 Tax=Pistacia integerrima TaxID=434235 RepID=A0ACC0XWM5_9ROSI|nr:hypothetical protein Pint_07051 [Pistacia integerrima]
MEIELSNVIRDSSSTTAGYRLPPPLATVIRDSSSTTTGYPLQTHTFQATNLSPSTTTNLSFSKVHSMEKDTVSEGTKYKLSLSFPSDYPLKPPKVKFETDCFRPNVDVYGNICWTFFRTILISVQSLLGEPNISFPLNSQAAQLWSNREVIFRREEMVYWLYYLTKASLNHADRIELLLALIRTGFHEFALQLLEKHKELATAYYETEKKKKKETALDALAQLPVANQQGIWKRIEGCFNRFVFGHEEVEVKKLNPLDVEAKNRDGKTPRALFSQEHQKLKDDGEKWMKDTANYCMVVASLITTMVFAAALAIQGGTSDETGTPHFRITHLPFL